MPRKLLRRYLARSPALREHRALSLFREQLHDPNLWHLNRRSVSGGVAVGLFCMYMPIPFEMGLAALCAIVFRVNLPIAVALVWISNPLTWVAMYGVAYLLGAWLLGEPTIPLEHVSLRWLGMNFASLWLGCLILGSFLALVGYLFVRAAWRINVIRAWRARRHGSRGNARVLPGQDSSQGRSTR